VYSQGIVKVTAYDGCKFPLLKDIQIQPMSDKSDRFSGLGKMVVKWAVVVVPVFMVVVALVLLVPNPLGAKIIGHAKAQGYIAYTQEEAVALAYDRCGGCHETDKIVKYCPRCGPPFIIVANFMKKYVDVSNSQGMNITQFRDAELVAIVQVWNALVGNWEADWRVEDMRKLLNRNKKLIALLETPPEKRPIEAALQDKVAPGSYKNYDTGGIQPDAAGKSPTK
jgi:hypothetical protein